MAVVGLDERDPRAEGGYQSLYVWQGCQLVAFGGYRGGLVAIEVEGVDAAVAPLLQGVGRQIHGEEPLGRGAPLGPQPGRAGKRGSTFNGETGQDGSLSAQSGGRSTTIRVRSSLSKRTGMVPPTLTRDRAAAVGNATRVVTSKGDPSPGSISRVRRLRVTGPIVRSSTTETTLAWAGTPERNSSGPRSSGSLCPVGGGGGGGGGGVGPLRSRGRRGAMGGRGTRGVRGVC